MPNSQGRSENLSWRVGEATVHRIKELDLLGLGWLLPGATQEVVADVDWLRPSFVDDRGELVGSVHTFAIESGGLRVLVDTGVGNHKTRDIPAFDHLDTLFLDRLAAAGFAPESVNLVLTTHLHVDHVGWNTRLAGQQWVPTFPNARYLVARTEYDYWTTIDLEPGSRRMFADSVDPVRDAGQFDLVDVPPGGVEVASGLRLEPTPGHTPGHVSVRLRSAEHTAMITGDCVHHPVQLARPALGSSVDVDPALATQTRETLFVELAGTDTLLLGTHFATPTAGLVRRADDGYRLAVT